MSRPRTARPVKKKLDRYHHGDLPRAMLQEAVRTIQKHGVDALTLRAVGAKLGVSRTALYRHFANKEALLGAVAGDGFRTLRQELSEAWEHAGRGRAGFDAMGAAYVRFAIRHPSHYRVMFGGHVRPDDSIADPDRESRDAFAVLVGAIVEQQRMGLTRPDDPQLLALYIWSVVHGIAMLALDGILETGDQVDALTRFAINRMRTGTGLGPGIEGP